MEDTKYSIICPACGKKMTKVRIKELDNMLVDICLDGCGGCYFDNQELKKITKSEEVLNKIIKLLESKNFPERDSTEILICPTCGAPMVKMGKKIGLIIDACHVCGGEYLDFNELKKYKNLNL